MCHGPLGSRSVQPGGKNKDTHLLTGKRKPKKNIQNCEKRKGHKGGRNGSRKIHHKQNLLRDSDDGVAISSGEGGIKHGSTPSSQKNCGKEAQT